MAIPISRSFVITSAGAINTTDSEAAFSMQYMDSWPNPEEANFDRFSGAYERGNMKINDKYYIERLKDIKEYDVNYPDDENKYKMENDIFGREEKVYDSYHTDKDKIKELKGKVNKRTPDNNMTAGDIAQKIMSKDISKHYAMPYEMRLAKAIYRWVATEISYDYNSLAKGKDQKTGKNVSLRKSQDPLYVFDKNAGVCAGKSNLLNLMMRLADIPSTVIVSDTHAFNAVYLKDTNNNRQGWVLLDATWGAPKSDKNLQAGVEDNKDAKYEDKNEEKINPMVKGTAPTASSFMLKIFAMDHEYAQTIDKMIDPIYFHPEQVDDIKKVNEEIERKLNELNANNSGKDGFKLNKIKIIKDKNRNFLVEYETNVEQDKAEKFYENIQEGIIKNKAKDMIKEYDIHITKDNFEDLNENFAKKFNEINKSYSRATLNKRKEYYNEFKIFCKDLLNKYKQELTNNINSMAQYEKNANNVIYQNSATKITRIVDNMNKIIKSKIDILNNKYQGIVKIKSFNVNFNKHSLNIGNVAYPIKAQMQFDLPLEYAIEVIKKQSSWSDTKEFFSGLYDKTLAFKYANENMIDWTAHKIEEIVFGNWHDKRKENSIFYRKIDGITYKISGHEGKKKIENG